MDIREAFTVRQSGRFLLDWRQHDGGGVRVADIRLTSEQRAVFAAVGEQASKLRRQVEHTCPVCGKVFVGIKKAVYDSDACRVADYYRKNREKVSGQRAARRRAAGASPGGAAPPASATTPAAMPPAAAVSDTTGPESGTS